MAMQKSWAIIIGAILMAVGLIGFFNNPIFGLFKVNILHNLVHLVTGLFFVIAGIRNMPKEANQYFGVGYIIVAILGFLGFLAFLNVNAGNDLDNWLHLVIGIASSVVGWTKEK